MRTMEDLRFAALPASPRSSGPAGPAGSVHPGPMSRAFARASAMIALGRKMFFDSSLSASGRQACASCHDPGHAFGPPNALSVQVGGPALDQPGFRAVPSLRYLQAVPQFTEHFFDSDDEGDESVDNGPTGGLTWDGRVDRGREQARIPLLSPHEMANADAAAVVSALKQASYAEDLAVFGNDVFDHPDDVFDAAAEGSARSSRVPPISIPIPAATTASLPARLRSTQELRGRALFEDPAKSNCASCHLSEPANDEPPHSPITGLIAIAVPASCNPRQCRSEVFRSRPVQPAAHRFQGAGGIAACSRRRRCATWP
jgi:cytochrome c peroxidase